MLHYPPPQVTPRIHTLAKFLIELSLTDYSMLQFLPSQLAAASLSLAIRLSSKDGVPSWVSHTCGEDSTHVSAVDV